VTYIPNSIEARLLIAGANARPLAIGAPIGDLALSRDRAFEQLPQLLFEKIPLLALPEALENTRM